MANKYLGEVELQSKAGHYTLLLDINALCTLQGRLNITTTDIFEKLKGSADLIFLRHCVWAGLEEHHPDLDERDAGRIITAMGLAATSAKVLEAVMLAFPAPEDANAPPGPRVTPARKRRRGTGSATSRSGANSE